MTYGEQAFSLEDAGAYPFSSGTAGSLVDIVGVKSIQQQAQSTEIENRGDGAVIATVSTFDSINLTIVLGAFHPASVAAIAGGTVTTTGSTPAEVTKLERKSTDVVPYFKLAGNTHAKDDAGGGVTVTYPQAAWQSGPDFSLADQAFAEITVGAKAIPDSNDVLYTYEAMETFTALA